MESFEEFRKTARYKNAGLATSISVAFHYFDPEDEGLSETELRRILCRDILPEEVSIAVDMMSDKSHLHLADRVRDGTWQKVYRLDWLERDAIRDYIEHHLNTQRQEYKFSP